MFGEKTLQFMAKTDVFKGLSNDEINKFHKFFEKEVFYDRDVLIKQGQTQSALHIVISGALNVTLPKKTGMTMFQDDSALILGTLKSGDCFGEYSLVDKKGASASIIAVEGGEVLKIKRDDFENIISADDHISKQIYLNLLNILTKRLRKSNVFYEFSNREVSYGVVA